MEVGKLYKTNHEMVVGGPKGGYFPKGTVFTVLEKSKLKREFRILTTMGRDTWVFDSSLYYAEGKWWEELK